MPASHADGGSARRLRAAAAQAIAESSGLQGPGSPEYAHAKAAVDAIFAALATATSEEVLEAAAEAYRAAHQAAYVNGVVDGAFLHYGDDARDRAALRAASAVLRAPLLAENARLVQALRDRVELAKCRGETILDFDRQLATLRQENERLRQQMAEDVGYKAAWEAKADLATLRQRLAEAEQQRDARDEHGLPGWWALPDEDMPKDREWTQTEWLRHQLYLANEYGTAASLRAEAAEQQAGDLLEVIQPLIRDYQQLLGDGLTAENEPDILKRVRAALTRPASGGEARSEPQPADIEAIIARECSFSDEADAVRRCAPAIIAAARRAEG